MYPTLVIALVGAVPQYYQWAAAATMGLPLSGNVRGAQEQEMAWERNVNCLRGIDHIKPSSSTNYAWASNSSTSFAKSASDLVKRSTL
jgi:hypothetical protein